jgi:hypothetical protein
MDYNETKPLAALRALIIVPGKALRRQLSPAACHARERGNPVSH